MPSEKPQLRSSTTKEKIGDKLRAAFGNIAEQPLARIADALGITDFTGLSQPEDPNAMKLGMMPEGPFGPARPSASVTRGTKTKFGKLSDRDYNQFSLDIPEPHAKRVAQKHGVAVDPQDNIDWYGNTGNSRGAEQELTDLTAQMAFSSPRRPGRINAIPPEPVNQFELSRHAIDPNAVVPSFEQLYPEPRGYKKLKNR